MNIRFLLSFSMLFHSLRASKEEEFYNDILGDLDELEVEVGKLGKVEKTSLKQLNNQSSEKSISYQRAKNVQTRDSQLNSAFSKAVPPEPITYPKKEYFDTHSDASEINKEPAKNNLEVEVGKHGKPEKTLQKQLNEQLSEKIISYQKTKRVQKRAFEFDSAFAKSVPPEPITYPKKEYFDAYKDRSEINRGSAKKTPPYSGTLYPLAYSVAEGDSSHFHSFESSLQYQGTACRTFWRSREWDFDDEAHIFLFFSEDGVRTEFWIHSEFDIFQAKRLISKIGPFMGRIPQFLRRNLKVIQFEDGTGWYAGSGDGIVHIPKDAFEKSIREHWLEEVLVHEMGHTTLDAHLYGTEKWENAVLKDPGYISKYAEDYPNDEDVAESIVNWLAIALDTINSKDRRKTTEQIPNRLQVFDEMNYDLFPFNNGINPSTARIQHYHNWNRVGNNWWYPCSSSNHVQLRIIKIATCSNSHGSTLELMSGDITVKQCAKLTFENERCGDEFMWKFGANGWCVCRFAGASNQCYEDSNNSTPNSYKVIVNNKESFRNKFKENLVKTNQSCWSQNNNHRLFLARDVSVSNCALLAYNNVKCGKVFEYDNEKQLCGCGVVGTSNELCTENDNHSPSSRIFHIDKKDADVASPNAAPIESPVQIPTEEFYPIFVETFDIKGEYQMNVGNKVVEASNMDPTYSGDHSLKLRQKQFVNSKNLNIQAYSTVKIDFKYNNRGMENGEDFVVLIQFNGSSEWIEVGKWVKGKDFTNNEWNDASIITRTNNKKTLKFQIKLQANERNDRIFIDDVALSGILNYDIIESGIE